MPVVRLTVFSASANSLAELEAADEALSGQVNEAIRAEIERRRRNRLLADMQSKGARIGRPNIGPWRDAVKPVYVKAKEKYGADVDAILADAEAVRKALPAK